MIIDPDKVVKCYGSFTKDAFPSITQSGIGIAWSKEHADMLFQNDPMVELVLCIDVPICNWVTNYADACKFFDGGDEVK